jgi:hypothetical protein
LRRCGKESYTLKKKKERGIFMRVHYSRRFLVVLWLVFAAMGLSAQEKSVLNAGIVQNFVENLETIDTAFVGMENEEGFLSFADKMNEFQRALAAYLYGGDDSFPVFRTAFIQVKSVRAPSVEQVFSTFGLGQRGIEVFFVITLGMTISLMENEIETALFNIEANELLFDPDLSEELEALESIRNKLVMMRSLIHPDDMAILDKSMDMLLTLF